MAGELSNQERNELAELVLQDLQSRKAGGDNIPGKIQLAKDLGSLLGVPSVHVLKSITHLEQTRAEDLRNTGYKYSG
jgi:hypothetical protein